MGAAVHQFHRGVARKLLKRPLIAIDADIARRRGLTLHDRPAAEMGLDIGVMGRHKSDDRLT